MNQKGFAVTGIIYTLMVLFIILIVAVLAMFSSRKNVLDELKNKVLKNVNTISDISKKTYNPVNGTQEFLVTTKGYYVLTLTSSNGSILSSTIYLKQNEKLILKVGSKTYNNGTSEIASDGTTFLTVTNTNYTKKTPFTNRELIDLNYEKLSNTLSDGIITIEYISSERKNTDLNKIRYIKDCINGTDSSVVNRWSEIKIIIAGENKAYDILKDTNKAKVTDNNLTTYYEGNDTCIIIDLNKTYNIDYINVSHQNNKKYYHHMIMASQTSDTDSYKTIYNDEVIESELGVIVGAFAYPKTIKVGNIYLPTKEYLGSTWLRIFHHNNKSGTVLWNAKAQVIAENGYDELHKQSGLYYINDFKYNNRYELLLEYPDVDRTKYNRWIQTSDFTNTSDINGFVATKTDFTSSYAPFDGLKLNGVNTIISGNTGSYYSIGATSSSDNGIFGYSSEKITGTVDLWLNIDHYIKYNN